MERGCINNRYGKAVLLRLLRRDHDTSCYENNTGDMGLRDWQESSLRNWNDRSWGAKLCHRRANKK